MANFSSIENFGTQTFSICRVSSGKKMISLFVRNTGLTLANAAAYIREITLKFAHVMNFLDTQLSTLRVLIIVRAINTRVLSSLSFQTLRLIIYCPI
jgi:hypothetical protein